MLIVLGLVDGYPANNGARLRHLDSAHLAIPLNCGPDAMKFALQQRRKQTQLVVPRFSDAIQSNEISEAIFGMVVLEGCWVLRQWKRRGRRYAIPQVRERNDVRNGRPVG